MLLLFFFGSLWLFLSIDLNSCNDVVPNSTTQSSNACLHDSSCVQDGKCWRPKSLNHSVCLCPRSCPGNIPVSCEKNKHCNNGEAELGFNYCDKDTLRCLCPSSPQETCSKSDFKIYSFNVTTVTPFLGDDISFNCCVNINPREVPVKWLHNDTDTRRPAIIRSNYDKCWTLNITNIQYKDSGNYKCLVALPTANIADSKMTTIFVRAPVLVLLNVSVLKDLSIYAEWYVNSDSFSNGVSIQVRSLDPFLNQLLEFPNLLGHEKVIVGLQPGILYNVTVEAGGGGRMSSSSRSIRTPDTVTSHPVSVTLNQQSPDANGGCQLTWKLPSDAKEIATISSTCFKVHVNGIVRWRPIDSDVLFSVDTPSSLICGQNEIYRPVHVDCLKPEPSMVCKFEDMKPNQNYSVSVATENSLTIFRGSCITGYSVPYNIFAPVAIEGRDNASILIDVFPADEYNGPISCYYLAVVPFRVNSSVSFGRQMFRPPDLMVYVDYNRTVDLLLSSDDSEPVAYIAESFKTFVGQTRIVLGDQQNSVSERCDVDYLRQHSAFDGPLLKGFAYTAFLIVKVDPDPLLSSSALFKMDRRRRSQVTPSHGYSDYMQPPVFLQNGPPVREESYGTTVLWRTIVFMMVAVLIVFAVLAYVCYKLRKTGGTLTTCLETKFFFTGRQNSHSELTAFLGEKSFPPILAEDLPREYLKRHRDSEFLFRDEFESLPQNKFDTCASDNPENAHKNRYNDIKCYDLTRVKLEKLNGVATTDYINANFVQGYKGRRLFIAAQGPKEDTVADFWRMIWEHNVKLIVMVTNLQEKYRTMCFKYWSEDDASTFDAVRVEPIECCAFADYSIRKFKLTRVNHNAAGECEDPEEPTACRQLLNSHNTQNSKCHIVLQYHYTGWYDYRAPDCTVGLLRFISRLRKLDVYLHSLIVVHCSAGVGRTGTFIAIDAMLDQMAEEGRVDIYGFVSGMRRERNFMVQSLEQYVFVYKALAEFYLFGESDIEAERIYEHAQNLRSNVPGQNDTYMQQEFLKLEQSLEDQKSSDFAHKEFNLSRNRSREFVPFDRNRVILQPVASSFGDATYINASLIQGYGRPYILAQDPLPRTVGDFWRLIWEQGVNTIVMLSSESDFLETEIYWPQAIGKGLLYGERNSLGVQLVSVEESASCITRKMNLTNNQEKAVREVQLFAYRDWPSPSSGEVGNSDSLVPRHVSSFLDLIGKVQQRQSCLTAPGPVVVHCRTGAYCSGLYCAVSLLLERLKAEGKVDVFQTAKTLRAQRAHVVKTLAQYDFCYQAVLDYLEPFVS